MRIIVKCTQCGKKGLFLPVNNLGHCEECIARNKAAAGIPAIPSEPDANPGQSGDAVQVDVSDKNWTTTLLLSIFFGLVGIHRFYANRPLTGLLWLLTGGCLGFGFIIDIISIASGTFVDGNGAAILSNKQKDIVYGTGQAGISNDAVDQLKKLAELHAAGVLSDEEFKSKKVALLNRIK